MGLLGSVRNKWKCYKSLVAFTQLPRNHKEILIYSEGGEYWSHFSGMVEYWLATYDRPICFVSSSEDDPGLKIRHPNYHSFLIDLGEIRNWFFENVDVDLLVMSTPDLGQYQIKISKKPVHYVYLHHSMVSLHVPYREGAFDHFDTMFCAGPHHAKELRAIEKQRDLKPKNIVQHGYGRLDDIIAGDRPRLIKSSKPKKILIAPSWGESSIIPNVGLEVVKVLLSNGYQVTLRPHPETIKFYSEKISEIKAEFSNEDRFALDIDVSEKKSLNEADLMISDWSGAAIDFAFGMLRPVLFIDVPLKVNNASYKEIPLDPFERRIRTQIGDIVSVDKIHLLHEKIQKMLSAPAAADHLMKLRETLVYNLGESSSVGCRALLELLDSIRNNPGVEPFAK